MRSPSRNGLVVGALATLLLSACAAQPLVTRERMTLGEADIEGMECRKDKPINTNIPRTICASKESWARFDERSRQEAADLLAEGRQTPGVNGFNRPH